MHDNNDIAAVLFYSTFGGQYVYITLFETATETHTKHTFNPASHRPMGLGLDRIYTIGPSAIS